MPEILGLEEVSDEDLCPRLGEGVSSVILPPHESVHGVALFEELARDRRARISRRSSYQNSGFARHDVISSTKNPGRRLAIRLRKSTVGSSGIQSNSPSGPAMYPSRLAATLYRTVHIVVLRVCGLTVGTDDPSLDDL